MGVQVQELTQNLMPWGKEYIDFSFAGRHISEFGLVAVTSGDRYQFAGSPDFEDETSDVKGVWGQYYWGTNYKTKTYNYSLATDGMTERQFEDFKRHFRPGHYGQFYEDTWFDRYCYVRVKTVVDFTFIPFQEEAEVAGVKFSSRIYKGECKIQFIQDKPFMYSFYQVLDSKIADLSNANDNGRAAARMMYYSNIPARDSWTKNIKCATGSWFSLPVILEKTLFEKDENGKITKRWTEYEEQSDNSIIYEEASFIPFYNPSTIASEANIEFTIQRSITPINTKQWQPVYFNEIYDSITNSAHPYNTISITDNILSSENGFGKNGRYIKSFKYGLPEVSSDINKAINIAWHFYEENEHGALVELQERLQEELINGKVLLWAVRVLQKIQLNQNLYYATDDELKIQQGMLIDDNDTNYLMTEKHISILDKATEEAYGEIIFHAGDSETIEYDEKDDFLGCFKTNKITVYPYPISEEFIEVDWFGYFNIMMLMIFAKCNDGFRKEDITTKGTFGDFYPYTLNFIGEKGQTYITYKINQLNSDSVIYLEEIQDENCSNIVASNYLQVDGGDTINISTGKVASYHILGFNHGIDETISVKNIKLEYKYTYA